MKYFKDVLQIYQVVQCRINSNVDLEDYLDKEKECAKIYAEIVKSEPAIMEWEVDYWGRYGKWGMPLFTFFTLLFCPLFIFHLITGAFFERYDAFLAAALLVFFPVVMLILGAEWFPVRYYQKITASGFYSYGVKVGSERRKKMAKYCMIGGLSIAVILLFVAGPMVFAGAGAASLSFLKLGSIPEPEPKESAWPWLGIYSLIVTKPFLYNKYKVQTHGYNDLILTAEQLKKVIGIINDYGHHDLDVLYKKEDSFFDRWWHVQDRMPFDDINPR
ncbi:hypothetical protein L4174_021435 [Photobacterium sp. CCB-ST2H9]|uniref:hypothetical protein n=1 Tax=Photobacterium sp. CCB-ST2H9 TaxID=2912855 RepID=UPI002004608D|nr:hypothetical protein [Photobacterium sp. CCB-ST2H9]UTM59268.1 hypothetical protein L4174_021435 [Photobacterium sp. CCB-ST2H9]